MANLCGVWAQTASRTPDALTICHNLPMWGRYRLSRRKQMIEQHFDAISGVALVTTTKECGIIHE